MIKKIAIICGLLSLLVGCKKEEPNIELIRNMMISPAVKSQDQNNDRKDKRAMRMPPEGTVAQNREVYMHAGNPSGADRLPNPVKMTAESLKNGKEKYEIYCMVCHGKQGLGDGLVAKKLTQRPPPSLVNSKIKSWSDGRLYHVITAGQGMMGSYASQIHPQDRWKIVNYIRELQKQ